MDFAGTNRRSFLQTAAAGALGGIATGATGASGSILTLQPSPEDRVRELGLELPEPQGDSATLVPAVLSGNMLYVSGHGPRAPQGTRTSGKLGADMDIEEGAALARLAALNVLATVRNSLGSLNRVSRLVKTLGMVNSAPDFTRQSQVVNGFSQLMIDVFGESLGKGARSAVGMSSLPVGWAIEVEAIFEVREG
jgi:enamine deaminase RidA (YjgF/YER057c/UK114 family)